MRKPLLVCVTLGVIAIAIAIYLHFTSLHAEVEPFEARRWKLLRDQARQNDPGCVRGGMAKALLQDGLFEKLDKVSVLSQLGPADSIYPHQIRYDLGQCHWGWNHSVLVIDFKTDGAIDQVSIEMEDN